MSNEALRVGSMRELAGRDTPRASAWKMLGPPVAVGVAYYLGCLAGFSLRYPGSGISFFWPPTAVLTAALLLSVPRWWPTLLAGALVAHGIAHSADGIRPTAWLIQFLGNGSQALIAAWFVRRYAGTNGFFGDARRILTFILGGCWVAPAVASVVPALVYVSLGWAEDFRHAWSARTVSNSIATLTIVPSLVLLWPYVRERRLTRLPRLAEFAVLLIGLVLVHTAVLPIDRRDGFGLIVALYAPMPLLLWATVRFGVSGLSFALVSTTVLTVTTALNGRGPLAALSPADTVVAVQLVLTANAIPMMLLAGVLEQQRREHRTLVDMEQQNRAILRALPDQMYLLARDGRCLRAEVLNPESGERPTINVGEDIHDALPPEARRSFSRALAAVGSHQPAVIEYTHTDNATRQRIEARLIAVDGDRVLTIARDITSRWRSEQELRDTQHRYALATTVGGIGVFDLDVANGELRVIGTLKQVLGYTETEISDRLEVWESLIHPDDREEVMARLAAMLAGDAVGLDIEFRLTHKDGTVRWINSKGGVTETANGTPTRVTGTYADITERRESARLLREANDAVVRMNRIGAIAEMSASIAHELNQPLTAISATAMTGLQWSESEPGARRFYTLFRDVLNDGRRATHVIERTRGMFSNQPAESVDLDLNDIARSTAEIVGPRLRELRMRVLLDLGQDMPAVRGDTVQIQQVLLNLINNAMDAMRSSSGSPRLLTIRTRRSKRHVILSVRDAGHGFGPAGPEHVFDRFYTTKSDGIGMGLAIARSIVQSHGGRLWAVANVAEGATFRMKLPQLTRAASPHKRLLVVDDDRSMRRSMARLLHSWGHQVAVASGTTRALTIAETFKPDVAILDLAIGDGSGLELARALRDKHPDRRIQLYAMTADNDETVRRACLAVFDAYLVKPSQLTELQRLLTQQPDAHRLQT
jgi:PAS domain S-box-containing protein